MPVTLRKVSCWPANEASGRSSAVADERTAKLAAGAAGREASELGADGGFQVRRERRVDDPLANQRTGFGQRTHVIDIQRGELVLDARVQSAVAQELPKRMRRGGKATGHPHTAGGQLADHFAERGVLAAYGLDVGHPQMFKRCDQGGRQGGQ
jgi:hypothetical protein